MKRKNFIILLTSVAMAISMVGCSFVDGTVEEMQKDYNWTKDNNAFTNGDSGVDIAAWDTEESSEAADNSSDSTGSDTSQYYHSVGETVTMSSDTEQMDVTVLDWGTAWSDWKEQTITYFDVEFYNTGSTTINVGPSLFSVYGDDYSVELSYLEADSLDSTSLDAGRKASGRVFAIINPDTVYTLEVQINNSIWILKDDSTSSAGDASDGDNAATDLPIDLFADTNSIANVAGLYYGLASNSTLDISMYSSPEDSAVGNVDIYLADDMVEDRTPYAGNSYSGEITEIQPNVYQLLCGDDIVIISFFTANDDGDGDVFSRVYVNGDSADSFMQVEKYES